MKREGRRPSWRRVWRATGRMMTGRPYRPRPFVLDMTEEELRADLEYGQGVRGGLGQQPKVSFPVVPRAQSFRWH